VNRLLPAAGLAATLQSLAAPAPDGAPIHPRDAAARVAAARPGEQVVLADGTYMDLRVVLRGRGAPGRPVAIRPATPGGVVFRGRAGLEVRGEWLEVSGFRFEECSDTPLTLRESRHCRIAECAVLRCNAAARLHWIRIAGAGSVGNRVERCYTEGKLTDGVVLTVEGDDGEMPQGTVITENHFRRVVRAVRNGMETIRIGTSQFGQLASSTVVEGNLFEGCSGDAEIISVKSCANVVRFNTFRGCDGAVTLRHGHRSRVYGNFLFGEGRDRAAGIRVHGSDHAVYANYLEDLGQFGIALPAGNGKFTPAGHEPTLRATVAHNSIVACRGPGLLLGGDAGGGRGVPPTECALWNNLVAGPTPASGAGDALRWAGNLFFGQAAEAPAPPGTLLQDPRLGRRDGLLRPLAVLPPAPRAPLTPEADVDGQPWPAQAVVGADQPSDAAPRRRPLTPADVGPSWLPPARR